MQKETMARYEVRKERPSCKGVPLYVVHGHGLGDAGVAFFDEPDARTCRRACLAAWYSANRP